MGLFGKERFPAPGKSVEMLEACGDVNGLVRALSVRDDELARKAMDALEHVGGPAVDPLLQLCEGRDVDLQLKAAIVLGRLRSRKAVPALVKLAYSPDASVRATACLSLGGADDDRAIGPLVYRLGDGSKDVRDAAAFSLSVMGRRIIPQVADGVAKANRQLVSTSENVATAKAAGNFDPALTARHLACRRSLDCLLDGVVVLLAGCDRPWRSEFLGCLFASEDTRDADLVIVRRCGHDILGSLQDAMRRERADVRLRAVEAVDLLEDERAIGALEQRLDDEDRAVREAAAAALRKVASTGLVDVGSQREAGPLLTFQCEFCGAPVECGKKYCPACGALFDTVGPS